MWFTAGLILLLAAGAIAGTVYLYFALPRWVYPRPLRLLILLTPLLACSALFALLAILCEMPQLDLNASNVAPTIALAKGFPLYPDPDNGMLGQWIDGPVAPLLMWPATFCTHATSAIITAGTVLLFICLAPALCLNWFAFRRGDESEEPAESFVPQFAILNCIAFIWLLLDQHSTHLMLSSISATAPATGLLMFALLPLLGNGRGRWSSIGISTTCLVLACWTKLSVWPAIFAIAIYLFVADRPRSSLIYLGALACIGLVISTAFLCCFGRSNLWFYVMTLPRALPWQDTHLSMWGRLLPAVHLIPAEIVWPAIILGLVILLGAYLMPPKREPSKVEQNRWSRIQIWFNENPWVLLAMVAVFLLPGACIESLTFHGTAESFGPVVYLILATASFMSIHLFRVSARSAAMPSASTSTRTASCVLLAFVAIIAVSPWSNVMLGAHNAEMLFQQIATADDNPQAHAEEDALAYPNSTYFPWNTLSTLLANGKYYQPELGVVYRYSSHLPPKSEQMLGHLPANLHYLAYGPTSPGRLFIPILGNPAAAVVEDPLLPKFDVFPVRNAAAAGPGESQ